MMAMAPRIFVFILLSIVLSWTWAHPLETETKTQLKKEIKGIKSEIQELFRRINELSSSKSGAEVQEVQAYENNQLGDVCLSKDCIAASHHLFRQMDLTADPCQDFNQYSCGTFIKEKPIPDDKTNYNAFSPPRDIG